jgi:putative SOS response-associated peptidase YedK
MSPIVWRGNRRPGATPFAFAGVYDVWKGDGGKATTSFAIVTTDAAPNTAKHHDNMPLVLEETQFDDWMRLHWNSLPR